MEYSDKVMEDYENPRNMDSFDKEIDDVFTGIVGRKSLQK